MRRGLLLLALGFLYVLVVLGVQKDGKHAIIKLAPGFSAEDIGMRVGIF